MPQPIDTYAEEIRPEKRTSVLRGTAASTEKRYSILHRDFEDPDALRRLAGSIKDHALHNLGTYLQQAEQALLDNGAHVHWALDGQEARETMSRAMNYLPIHVAPVAPLQAWLKQRTLPEFRGGSFRKWMQERKK